MQAQTSGSIEVRINGQTKATLPVVWHGNIAYVPAKALADPLGMKYQEYTQKKKAVFSLGQHTVTITQRNPFILVDKQAMQMPSPPLMDQDNLVIPITFFIYACQNIFMQKLVFDSAHSVLDIVPGENNIQAVIVDPLKNGCLIHIKTGKTFNIADISLSVNRKWLNMTIYGGTADSVKLASSEPVGMIQQIIPYVFEQSVQLSFLINQTIEYKDVQIAQGEILLSLRTNTTVESVVSNGNTVDHSRWLIDTIIIDPGHGGRDPGAIGAGGTREKDINLQIAKLLKDNLNRELPNVKILMTRETDSYPELKERTQFANKHNGKLFVSIHMNANLDRSVRGFSTYILGQKRSKLALEVAQAENSVVELFEEDPDAYKELESTSYILNKIAQNQYMKESLALAEMVNRAMKAKIDIPDKGVHQSGLWVLVGAAMPSILIETAYISNKHEERLLKSRSFQRKAAEAIGESICEFKKIYEKGI